MAAPNTLGAFLRDRRSKLDPTSLGLPLQRRRTVGLRREEVAQRANMSATWYTWLEQGRGGAPSPEVLERIADALLMTEVEREHAFLLAFGRPPAPRSQSSFGITDRLQRLLDSLESCPAMIRSCTWDVLAWNKATLAVFAPYNELPPDQRNILRLLFLSPEARAAQLDWEQVARSLVSTFRAESTRAGQDVTEFVKEMCLRSPDFERLWNENDVGAVHANGLKTIRHRTCGSLTFEYSSFPVDGRVDLAMSVFVPASEPDKQKVLSLLRYDYLCST